MPDLTNEQCEVINALAFSGMVVSEAARKCGIGWTAFKKRLDTIQKQTGLDPRDFFDLHDLYEMAGR